MTNSDADLTKELLSNEFLSSKFDLEQTISRLMHYRQKFFLKFDNDEQRLNQSHPLLDIVVILNSMSPSFLAPAYHFNKYVDAIIKDIMWNDIKWNIPEEEWDSSILRRANYQIEVQAMLLSIKIGLDRLVAIFHYYYKGFPSATTFGRYKNAKASGFMSTVSRLKATDKLMSFIDNEYHKWIHIAVFPRDTISHYNDLGITYHFDSETGAEIPIHYSNRLLQVKTEQETKEHSPVFHIENLREFAVNWYDFFDHVIDVLLTKPLIKQNPIL